MVRILEQSVILEQVSHNNPVSFLAKAARTCYQSEEISKKPDLGVVKMLITNQHLSVLEHLFITVRMVTSRGVTHELVRHRLASYSQESTRYCNYSHDRFDNQIAVIPSVVLDRAVDRSTWLFWWEAMVESEKRYFALLEHGMRPEVARDVLPTCLKTEIVVSANLREWFHIFDLRLSDKAHPDMRELMSITMRQFLREEGLKDIVDKAKGKLFLR